MTAVVSYDAGNVRSVLEALRRVGAGEVALTADPEILRSADRVILPGVGAAGAAMASLAAEGLDKVIPTLECPVLGICIGMQLMCAGSDEDDVRCLGIFPQQVRKFAPADGLKVPHMGWNTLEAVSGPLFAGFSGGEYVYYVHSFYAPEGENTIASTAHGVRFSAALQRDNFFGVQFHPEKSGAVGARILQNFLAL